MNDPIGQAIADYFNFGDAPNIIVHTSYTENEILSPSYFFRTVNEMPELEKKALSLCRGKVLDIGAGAGCHSLVLQNKGFDVTAVEKSELSANVMKKRGIKNVVCSDIFSFKESGFDTILLLMNGAGIGGSLNGLTKLLEHLKKILTAGGRIITDSSDISYLFSEDDGSIWIDLAKDSYYGEIEYEIIYKKLKDKFSWLFTDFETLSETAIKSDLDCKLIMEGNHYDFLAKLKKADVG